MYQVSKIDEILDTMAGKCHNCGVGHDSNLPSCSEARDESKQAILSAILEVKPAVPKSPFAHLGFDAACVQGYQKALDEWEVAIKELFGVSE